MRLHANRILLGVLLLYGPWGRSQNLPRPVLTPEAPPPSAPAPVQVPPATVPTAVQSVPAPAAAATGTGATPAVTQPVQPATQVDASYVIGPEDDVNINVWREQSYSGNLTVRPDGKITMPLLGDLQASGFTPLQLAADITERLKKYLTDPLVTVTIMAVRSKRIYLAGEFGRPGPMTLTPDMTPMQAIIAAGGLGPYANPKHVYILRTVGGKEQRIPFNYKTALKTGDMQGVVLKPGDTIVAQ